jgi:hypothetical protein
MNKTIEIIIRIKWNIKGFDSYGFGEDKNLYNLKTGRKLKQSYNSGSIGYWFGKKFYSLTKLKKMLYKPIREYVPF